MEDEKPSTKHLVLKPRVVVPTDPLSRPGDGTAISVQLFHQQNRVAEDKSARRRRDGSLFPASAAEPEPDLPAIFKPKDITPMDRPTRPGEEEAIRVDDILLENRIAEERSGWGRIRHWRRRRSRRTRDFLIVVGSVDVALVIGMREMPSVLTMAYGVGAVVLFTSMVGWIMFAIMDDY